MAPHPELELELLRKQYEDSLERQHELYEDRKRLAAALRDMVTLFKPPTAANIGSPGSSKRIEQAAQIKAHANARKLLEEMAIYELPKGTVLLGSFEPDEPARATARAARGPANGAPRR